MFGRGFELFILEGNEDVYLFILFFWGGRGASVDIVVEVGVLIYFFYLCVSSRLHFLLVPVGWLLRMVQFFLCLGRREGGGGRGEGGSVCEFTPLTSICHMADLPLASWV